MWPWVSRGRYELELQLRERAEADRESLREENRKIVAQMAELATAAIEAAAEPAKAKPEQTKPKIKSISGLREYASHRVNEKRA